jgi:hypothetical protein
MADPTPTDPAPADPASATDPATAAPPSDPKPDQAAKQPPWGDPENFNAEKAWELIQNLRAEKGDPEKVTALETQVTEHQTAQQAQMDALAKALGLKPDDTPPDPAVLAEEITAEQGKTAEATTRAETAERKLAVFLAAGEHAANPLALIDSQSFMTSIKDVDLADAAKLGEAIKEAVEKNGHFKITPGTPPLNGGPRPPALTRAGSLEEAIAARFSSNTH